MFSFFSKKSSVAKLEPAEGQAPSQPHNVAVDPEAAARQLRTPSPSVAPSNDTQPHVLSSPPPVQASDEPVTLPGPEPTVESLSALITSVPPKILHTYVLNNLPTAELSTLESLATFFVTLTPPPRLHCVRCHADYVEVENSDRSCHVPHDDDSAEIERIGRGMGGAEYETIWGCCGQTVEGDGSEGPPNGWCYEGKHTTDIKRARFRADSTPSDDKLVSCLRLNCHGARDALPRRPNKRRRAIERDPAEIADDAASSGTDDSGVAEIARGVGDLGQRASATTPRKPKSAHARSDDGASASAKKPRARSRKETISKDKGKGKAPADAMDVDEPAPASSSPVKKPRARPRKQPAKEKDNAETGAESDAPTPSRGCGARGKTPQVEVVLRSRSQSRMSRARPAAGAETDGEGAKTDGEDRRRKKRKTATATATATATTTTAT